MVERMRRSRLLPLSTHQLFRFQCSACLPSVKIQLRVCCAREMTRAKSVFLFQVFKCFFQLNAEDAAQLTLHHVSASCGSHGGVCMLVYFLPSWANPKLTASKAVWDNIWDHHNTLQWVLFPVIPRKQISEGLPLQPHNHSQFLSLERLNNWSTGLPSGFWLSFICSNLGTWRPLKWSSAFLCCVPWDQEQFLHMFTGTCPSSSALCHDSRIWG